MSNNNDFAATMYESDPVVAALNKVPGFDPLKLMNRRRNPGAEKNERDLDFRYKKLWFRLAHRQGRIRLNKLSVTEQLAIFEAQVYLELTDANPISSFTATCTREEAGSRYIEGAQIKAMDQALTDAGFGLQFVPAPAGGTENTTMQAAISPAANVQMSGTAPKAVQAAVGTGNAQVSVAAPRKVQQTAVQLRTVAPQAAVQQKPVAIQPTVQTVQQAAAQQRTVASQQAVQRPASAPQQRPMTQQTAVQQKPAAVLSVVQQQTVVPQATVQQRPAAPKPVAPQTRVQQGETAPQQRSAVVKQQPAAPQSAAPAKSAQTVQTAQGGQKETPRPAQAPAGMQKAAVNPAASASSQKPAAAAAPAPQPAVGLPAGAEALPAEQPPVTAQEQTQPITSDVAAAISMLSGKKEPDTLPIAPEGTKEKAETIPEKLPAAPTAATAAAPAAPTTAAPESTAPAANAPAASADQTAKEDKPYTEATPVEEIIKSMTLEDAKKVVVPSGTCRGWTVAEVAERRRPSLKFYLSEGYQGRDNILRAAARIVLDDLEKMAG